MTINIIKRVKRAILSGEYINAYQLFKDEVHNLENIKTLNSSADALIFFWYYQLLEASISNKTTLSNLALLALLNTEDLRLKSSSVNISYAIIIEQLGMVFSKGAMSSSVVDEEAFVLKSERSLTRAYVSLRYANYILRDQVDQAVHLIQIFWRRFSLEASSLTDEEIYRVSLSQIFLGKGDVPCHLPIEIHSNEGKLNLQLAQVLRAILKESKSLVNVNLPLFEFQVKEAKDLQTYKFYELTLTWLKRLNNNKKRSRQKLLSEGTKVLSIENFDVEKKIRIKEVLALVFHIDAQSSRNIVKKNLSHS